MLTRAFKTSRLCSHGVFCKSAFMRPSNHTFSSSNLSSTPSINTTSVVSHPAYRVKNASYIEELDIHATLYEHIKTGAEIMSLVSKDNNKVFGITFRTLPSDSTGLPHILEHSVLCGSRKYKTKEPFAELLRGSLNTFLNAFTYPDRTCYPVASINTKDFYNLVDVYLDAVLYPRAIHDPLVLKQEGWHFELPDKEGPLTYKGVVYNEMKGVYSSPDSLLDRETQRALFPDNPYHVDSGGCPTKIPDLTFNAFKEFHQKNYHPSNAKVFFYGNDDPLERLQKIDEYFKDFDKIPCEDTNPSIQKKLALNQHLHHEYPASGSEDNKNIVTLNWLLNEDEFSGKEAMAISLLNHLLLGRPSSALRKILTESGLGAGLAGGGISSDLKQSTFSIGMKGVDAVNSTALIDLIDTTLRDLSEKGFDDSAIKASLNVLEFNLREFNTGGHPKGLSIMLGIMRDWIYDRDPFDAMRFEKPLQEVKADLAEGKPVFQDLLKKYFVTNTHKVRIDMVPSVSLEEKQSKEESDRLQKIKSQLSPSDLDEIIANQEALLVAQSSEDSEEAKATIPRLQLSDLDRHGEEFPVSIENLHLDITLLSHDLPTNGILYADIGFDFSRVSIDSLYLLPLFSRLLREAGTKTMDEVTLSRFIDTEIGGLHFSWKVSLKSNQNFVQDPDEVLTHLFVRGKCIADKSHTLFNIMNDLYTNVNFDNQRRALEVLKEAKANREENVIGSGHSFASMRLSATKSFNGYFSENTGGLTFARNLDKLILEAETNWDQVKGKLAAIRDQIFRRSDRPVIINLTGDEKTLEKARQAIQPFVKSIPVSAAPNGPTLVQQWNIKKAQLAALSQNEGIVIPSKVNYVAKGGSIFAPGETTSGSYSVVSRFISSNYLWDNVRVMGGAYGSFSSFGARSGRIAFLSYRDPNILPTIEVYDNVADTLLSANLTDDDITQLIIGSIGDLDSPMSADQKGFASMAQYLEGETTEDRERWRAEVLSSSKKDFHAFAEKLKKLKNEGKVVVVGSRQALEEANSKLSAQDKLVLEDAFK